MKWDGHVGGGSGGVISSTLQEIQRGTLAFSAVIFLPPLSLLLGIGSWWISGASALLCVTPLLSNIWKWFIMHFTQAHPLTCPMMQPAVCAAQVITWRIDIFGAVRRWMLDIGQKCFPCCTFAKSLQNLFWQRPCFSIMNELALCQTVSGCLVLINGNKMTSS